MYERVAQSDVDAERDTYFTGSSSSRRCSSWLFAFLFCGIGLMSCVSFFFHQFRTSNEQARPTQLDLSRFANVSNKHLVIASTSHQDVSWLVAVPSEWTVKRYMMDVAHPDEGLEVPRNYGREAMAYLTYIIDHYDDLPDYVVFVHGHHRTWHQHEPIAAKIRALNLTALEHENYVSFRCENNMGCERVPYIDTNAGGNWWGDKYLREFWSELLPDVELPRYISYKCCAQHAVTRQAIQSRTREQWSAIRAPLLEDPKTFHDKHAKWFPGKGVPDEWLLGAWYEKFWHLFFGADPHYCPSLQECRQKHFSNAIICEGDGDTTPWEKDPWQYMQCITAFDGLGPDDRPDWKEWEKKFISRLGELRENWAAHLVEQRGYRGVKHAEHIIG